MMPRGWRIAQLGCGGYVLVGTVIAGFVNQAEGQDVPWALLLAAGIVIASLAYLAVGVIYRVLYGVSGGRGVRGLHSAVWWGGLLLVLGLSGDFVLRGTDTGLPIVVVGGILLVWGLFRSGDQT